MKLFLVIFSITSLLISSAMTLARREKANLIALAARGEEGSSLHLMDPESGTVHKITTDHLCATMPRLSADGQYIAYFASDCTESEYELLQMQTVGDMQEVLSSITELPLIMRWSPNGERLLLSVINRASISADTIIVDTQGTQSVEGDFRFPQWSPDGNWIYGQYYRGDVGLIRIRVTTGATERLVSQLITRNPLTWSPNGSIIALARQTQTGDELFLMPADGSTFDQIPGNLPPHQISEPQWSPDGNWIAFLGQASVPDDHIYRIRPDGSDLQQISVRAGAVQHLQWSADGSWLFFKANYDGKWDIFRLRANGSTMENLTPMLGQVDTLHNSPYAGMDWHPLLLIVGALGIFTMLKVRYKIIPKNKWDESSRLNGKRQRQS